MSAAYLCVPREGATPEPREEARRVETFPVADRPPLGFDHERIAGDALDPHRGQI